MLPQMFNNNADKIEAIQTLEATDPDILFEESFKTSPLRFAFADFFKKNYAEVESIREVTYSTNHVTYYLFKNNSNNDIRILRAESGCFHSNQNFVSVDFIENHIQSLVKEKEFFMNSENYKQESEDVDKWCDTKINSVKKVITSYQQLVNSVKPKPKM